MSEVSCLLVRRTTSDDDGRAAAAGTGEVRRASSLARATRSDFSTRPLKDPPRDVMNDLRSLTFMDETAATAASTSSALMLVMLYLAGTMRSAIRAEYSLPPVAGVRNSSACAGNDDESCVESRDDESKPVLVLLTDTVAT